MFVNLSVLRHMNKSSGLKVPLPSIGENLSLKVARFAPAPSEQVKEAEQRALRPDRLNFAMSSPLIEQYARALHPPKGADTELWLLDKTSVANTILAPLERKEELTVLFAKKGITMDGPEGILNTQWTGKIPKLYDGLMSVTELVNKYIDQGEVGRGRNKTSLKTEKQVVNIVVAALKKGGLLKRKK